MRILQVLTYVDMKTGMDEHEEDGRLNIIMLRKCLLDDTRVLFEDSEYTVDWEVRVRVDNRM